MIKLAETYIHVDIQLKKSDQKALQNYLQERARIYADGLFRQEPQFVVEVENGSIKTWIIVGGILYAAVAQYGSFRSGLDYLIKDARTFSERVLQNVRDSGVSKDQLIRFERRLGVPGKIRRIFDRIERLEKRGRGLSKDQYDRDFHAIRTELLNILNKLDDKRDIEFVLKSTSPQIHSSLPDRIPAPSAMKHPQVALRPEEREISLSQNQLTTMVEGDGKLPEQIHRDKLYRFKVTEQGFMLVPEEEERGRRD